VTLLLSGTASKAPALTKLAQRVVDVSVGYNKEEAFLKAKFKEHGVHAEPAAVEFILDRIGEEVERIDALARTLASVFGSEKITASDIEPYLGQMGNVPEWDLTDAVDKGRVAVALRTVRRMIESEGRVPVQIIGILQRHYLRLASLQNAGAANAAAVMALLGLKEYPAKKLLATFNALGTDRVAQAVRFVAQADVDVKGATALEPEVVLEVLVARLAKMSEGARR
jgi:DNA polymerase-3 subunit delta